MNLAFISILSFWMTAAVAVIYYLDPLLAYALGVAAGVVLVVLGLVTIVHTIYNHIKRITWRSK